MKDYETKERFKKMSIPLEVFKNTESPLESKENISRIFDIFNRAEEDGLNDRKYLSRVYELLSKEGVVDRSNADIRGKAECEKYIKALENKEGFSVSKKYHQGNPYWQGINHYGNEVMQQSSMRAYINIDKCAIYQFSQLVSTILTEKDIAYCMKFALQDTRADGLVIYTGTPDFYHVGNIINDIVNANQWIEKYIHTPPILAGKMTLDDNVQIGIASQPDDIDTSYNSQMLKMMYSAISKTSQELDMHGLRWMDKTKDSDIICPEYINVFRDGIKKNIFKGDEFGLYNRNKICILNTAIDKMYRSGKDIIDEQYKENANGKLHSYNDDLYSQAKTYTRDNMREAIER